MATDSAVQVQVQANPFDLPPLPEEQKPSAYWLGTLPSCPQYNVAVGGVMFHRHTDPPMNVDRSTGETQRAFNRGSVEHLTRSQVEAVKANMRNKIVRFHGNSGRGSVHNTDSRFYTRLPGDQPLAMFLYMVALDEQTHMMRSLPNGGYPPSVYEMAGGAAVPVVPQPVKPVPDVAPEVEDLDKPADKRHTPPQLAGRRSGKE